MKYQSEGTRSRPLFPHLVESLPTSSGLPVSEKSCGGVGNTDITIQQVYKQREAHLRGREAPLVQTPSLIPFSAE